MQNIFYTVTNLLRLILNSTVTFDYSIASPSTTVDFLCGKDNAVQIVSFFIVYNW